jgi:hypothetical protein
LIQPQHQALNEATTHSELLVFVIFVRRESLKDRPFLCDIIGAPFQDTGKQFFGKRIVHDPSLVGAVEEEG